jgi:hypothetical protein
MSTHSAVIRTSAVALLVVVGCQDAGHVASAPPKPPVSPSRASGMLVGHIEGSTMTATYSPVGVTPSFSGAASPELYGNQGTTINVKGKVISQVTNPVTHTTLWHVSISLHNLLTYPIGANYSQLTAAPLDTMGVFAYFKVNPVVTLPAGCHCNVTVVNAMGSKNFDAPSQKYFWYRASPRKAGAPLGTDSTAWADWQFQSTPSGVSFTDTAHAFTFVLMISAAWPPTLETSGSWTVNYDGTNDSLPNTQAEPRWRPGHFQGNAGSTVTWSAGGLVFVSNAANRDTVLSRQDSLGPMSAEMDVSVNVTAGGNNRIAAVFGFIEPSGGKQFTVGVTGNKLMFDTIATSTFGGQTKGVWSLLTGSTTIGANGAHLIRIRKIGTTRMEMCVDHGTPQTRTYAQLQGTTALLGGMTTFFGIQGRNLGAGGASVTYTSVVYTIGAVSPTC